MALDATVGGASANSFMLRARADALAADHPHAAAWATYSGAEKDQLLIGGARILMRQCFLGQAATEAQALPFPRKGLLNRNGYALDETTIPLDIELAHFELALMLGESDISRGSDAAAEGISELKAGPVTLKFSETFEERPVPQNVLNLLVPSWLCPTATATLTFFAT